MSRHSVAIRGRRLLKASTKNTRYPAARWRFPFYARLVGCLLWAGFSLWSLSACGNATDGSTSETSAAPRTTESTTRTPAPVPAPSQASTPRQMTTNATEDPEPKHVKSRSANSRAKSPVSQEPQTDNRQRTSSATEQDQPTSTKEEAATDSGQRSQEEPPAPSRSSSVSGTDGG